jgi:redox-sensitive bicupin YhaK (pirin superfamily)
MITIRRPEEIYQAHREIEKGTFHGRWHFSFDRYRDPEHIQFGSLRVFNDDTLSPGAVWPLHPHENIEVVTYCAAGEFRHADQRGKGGVLKQGWVQHTTVGSGMYHSEINNRPDQLMRFIQMWFLPSERDLAPSMEQKAVSREERLNRFLPLVSNDHKAALPIHADAQVHSCLMQKGKAVPYQINRGWGAYLYVMEGGPIQLESYHIPALGAAQVQQEKAIRVQAEADAELLLVSVRLAGIAA